MSKNSILWAQNANLCKQNTNILCLQYGNLCTKMLNFAHEMLNYAHSLVYCEPKFILCKHKLISCVHKKLFWGNFLIVQTHNFLTPETKPFYRWTVFFWQKSFHRTTLSFFQKRNICTNTQIYHYKCKIFLGTDNKSNLIQNRICSSKSCCQHCKISS